MNRYFKAFSVTLLLYLSAVVGFFYLDNPINLQIESQENLISLNHLSFLEQKEVKQVVSNKIKRSKERVQKDKIVLQKKKSVPLKQKKKKVEKKEITNKQQLSKETIKDVNEKIVKNELKQSQPVHKLSQLSYEEEFNQQYLKEIIRLIQKNMKYPRRARSLNIQGEVVIEFTLLSNGKVNAFTSIQGHRLLKKSAIKAIKRASLKFPKVKKNLRLKVPIVFSLS